MTSQSAKQIIMVRPSGFGSNPETSESNKFQRQVSEIDAPFMKSLADAEFVHAVQVLRAAGVDVRVEDEPSPGFPDAIFPNNWFSTDSQGKLTLYPMSSPTRRNEKRAKWLTEWQEDFQVSEVLDLSIYEAQDRFLEGTGSLVLDRVAQRAYAAIGPRTDETLHKLWCASAGYEGVDFEARDSNGFLIYHTNVMLSIGSKWAVVCKESIAESDRSKVWDLLSEQHELVDINFDQMNQFAGNILEIQTKNGPIIAASASAWDAFSADQQATLSKHARPIVASIPTIESVGGGSLRCMIAENFLTKKDSWF